MTPYSTLDRTAPAAGNAPSRQSLSEGKAEQELEQGHGNRTSQASISAALAAVQAGALSPLASALNFPGEDGGSSLAQMAQNDLDAALQLLADRAQYITGANGAAIALRRNGRNDMQCRASAGANVPELGALLSTEFGISGESVRTRQPLRCDDAERDPRVNREGCRQLGIASVVVMPVVNDDEVLGVFELFSGKVNAFGERDLSALQRLSEMVETAVRLARAAEAVPSMSSVAAGEISGDEEILGEEIFAEEGLAAPVAASAEEVESPAGGIVEPVQAESALPELARVEAPAVARPAAQVAAAVPGVAVKKPLFWSVAMSPVADAEKVVEADRSHVPPVLRNLRTCEACGFPVSPGRSLCVECEEKRWRGQLKRPASIPSTRPNVSLSSSSSLDQKSDQKSDSKSDVKSDSKSPLLAKNARNGAPTVPMVEGAASGPVAHLVAAAAAAAPALARQSATSESAPVSVPAAAVESAHVSSPAVLTPTAAVQATASAPESSLQTSSSEFVLSAGLEPSQSWLGRNKYIFVALLVVAAGVAAVVFLR